MALRARPPEAVMKRLKMFLFSPAGVGKTTAAIQFPNSYIIDGERGAENYDELIRKSGSVIFQTTSIDDVIQEVRALLTEKHQFRTLVIDPITPIYNDLLDKSAIQVGEDFGRHYGAANKVMKRLANLLMSLDMNVIVTAHAKTEYGENLKKLGYTFDGWRNLDYFFDLVLELSKAGKKRYGKIIKTRIETFEDGERFEWSYQAVKDLYEKQYGAGVLDRESVAVTLATVEQVKKIKELLGLIRLPDGLTDKWLRAANVDDWSDMPTETIGKCIGYIESRMNNHEREEVPV